MKCASQEKARGGGGWWEIPPTMRGAGGWTTMVAAVAAALCLQSAPPLPPATRNARTVAAVVTEVEWTSSCVAEEPKGGSAANLSDPFGVWAYAGTWPHKYALPPRGGCGYSTHTTGDSSRVVSADSAPAVPVYLVEACSAWWDPFWWLCRWTEAPGLECREHGGAWCLVAELRYPGAWCRSRYFSCRAHRAMRKRERLLRRQLRVSLRRFRTAVALHPFSLSGGCSPSGAGTEVASDALLAEVGARRRVVLSNDDCGYIALHSGTAENVGPAILDDDVADLRRELADFTEALKPVENLFADADTFADYVAGIRNRGWVDALTLHLAAALWGRRILVVQDGQHPVVCIAPPTQNGKRGAAEKKPWAVVHSATGHFSGIVAGDDAMAKLQAMAKPAYLDPGALQTLPIPPATGDDDEESALAKVSTGDDKRVFCPVDSCYQSVRGQSGGLKRASMRQHMTAHRKNADLVSNNMLRPLKLQCCGGREGCPQVVAAGGRNTVGKAQLCGVCSQSGYLAETEAASPSRVERTQELPAGATPLPSLVEIAQRNVALWDNIPRELVGLWAELLAAALEDVAKCGDELAWRRLLMLPKAVLVRRRGGKGKAKGKIASARDDMLLWRDGKAGEVWENTRHLQRGEGAPPPEQGAESRERRAVGLAREGQASRAASALVSRGLLAVTDNVLQQMRDKHPVGEPVDRTQFRGHAKTTRAPVVDVYRELCHFKNGTASGPTGLKPAHIRAAAEHEEPHETLQSLAAVVNDVTAGQVPKEVLPLLMGANIVPLRKNADDEAARPVAPGETLRRLCAKRLNAEFGKRAGEVLLEGRQVGVGIPMGMEAAITTVAQYASRHAGTDKVILKIDFRNAFNTVDRSRFLAEAQAKVGVGIMPFLLACYAEPTSLFCGGEVLQSTCGVQQGDPLGPMLFSLAIHEVTEELVRMGIQAVWYLDDGTIMGSPEEVARGYQLVAQKCAKWGLSVNAGKCEVIALARQELDALRRAGLPMGVADDGRETQDAQPGTCFRRIPGGDFELLGAPIGSKAHCEEWMRLKVQEFFPLLRALKAMQDSQVAASLLRQCGAFSRVVFYMRCTGHTGAREYLETFDRKVEEALCGILGSDESELPPEARVQAGLAVRRGGLGIRWAVDHSEAAVLAAMSGTHDLCRKLDKDFQWDASGWADTAAAFNKRVAADQQIATDERPEKGVRQRVLSQAVEQRQHDELVERADDIGTARLLSLLLPYTGAFLTATPSWDARVPRKDFQAVVRFRLGVQVYDEGSTCDACLEKQDPWGLHVTGCERRHDRFERHDAVVHAVAAKFNELGIKAKIEVRDIIADTQRRPGDVALPAGVTGKRRVAVDVTIRTPFAASVLRGAATTIGYAASQGEAAKRGYCEEKCSREGWDFLPFAMEVFGGFGGAAAGLVRRCGRFASRAQSADVVAHIGRTSAHISAAFQRALGASFSRRGISTSLLRERTEREVAGPIPPDPDGSPLRAPLREEVCVDFDADAEVGMEEESVPEFREPIARAKEKVDVAERKVVRQGAEEAAADSGPPPALGILDQPALAVSPPNPDFDAGAGGDTEGAARSTSAEGLLPPPALPPPPPALPPPPPALRARARGVSMAAEAGHRRDIGARSRVRFAEGCLQGRRDAGSAGETEAAAVVVLAAVVAGTVAGGRSELARAVTAQPPPAVLAPPVVQGGEAETAGEAGGDSAAGGSSADAPTPASRLSAPTAVDPPMVQDEAEVAASAADDNSAAGGISTDAPAPAPQLSSPVAADPPPDQGEELDGPARVAAADAKLDAVLAASGGARQAVAKDGACQFAAVAVQVSGWTAATLRKAAVDMLEQDDMLAGFVAAEGGAEYLARLRRPDGWGDSLSLEAICRAAGLSVWVLTVSEKGVPGLFRMGEEGWILAFLTQRPGHYDAFTVPEALQQAAQDGRLCLHEGRLVAAEADGAATAAVDDSAMGGGMADAPAPTPQPPPAGAGPRSVQEDVAEVAVAEADGDGAAGGIPMDAPAPASQSSSPAVADPPPVQETSAAREEPFEAADVPVEVAEVAVAEADGDGAAGGISTNAPAPASQSSSPVVADPPVLQEAGAAAACKPRSVKELVVARADRRAGYREVAAAEQAAKRADVQSQRRGAQAAARLRQARCGRGDEEEGVDPAEEPATHAASQSSGVALAEHAGAGAMEQDSPVSVCSSHVPNALAMRARDSMESQCDPATEVQPGGAHTAAPPEAGGQPMADEADEDMESQCDPATAGGAHSAAPLEAGGQPMADEEDDGEEYEFN